MTLFEANLDSCGSFQPVAVPEVPHFYTLRLTLPSFFLPTHRGCSLVVDSSLNNPASEFLPGSILSSDHRSDARQTQWILQARWPTIPVYLITKESGYGNYRGLYASLSPSSLEEDPADQNRYYCCTNQQARSPSAPIVDETPSSIEAPTGDEQPTTGRLSKDITLTALAQLGVLRLGCNRSFVSLIDGDNQHIIAEATASISLRDVDKHLPNDGIYLGARVLDLVWGVCPHTIRLFTSENKIYDVDTQNVTANRTRYVIRDFTKEDCFKDRPYVVGWPHMRFYAEVPLTSPAGYVLGSYCVVDDKPRDDFSEEEIDILQEISDAIANHLENKRIAHYHSRFERLVTGLTDFSKDRPDLNFRDSADTPTASEVSTIHGSAICQGTTDINNSSDKPLTDEASRVNTAESVSLSAPQTEPKSPLFPKDLSSSTEPSSLYSNLSLGRPTPGEERPLDSIDEAFNLATKIVPRNQSAVSLSECVNTADRIRSIFSRASSLLRDAMNLDGVLFLDASRSRSSSLVVP